MSDLSDVFDMKCFTECVINGTYDQVADAVDHLGKDALANADFGTDWGTAVEDHTSGTNWSYVDKKTGRPFRTNIVGQIACSQFGTKHSAKGTHFSKKKPTKKTAVRNVAEPPQRAKRKFGNDNSAAVTTQSSSSTASASTTNPISSGVMSSITEEAFHDPHILPDYRGDYFQLRQSQLHQLNIYDTKENEGRLVPMNETYSKMRPGTLILATFQLAVHAIRILSSSDAPVEDRPIPVLSTSSTTLSNEDSAFAAFSAFDTGLNAAKKFKPAEDHKKKSAKGKEKEKID
ncbi:hypothetical protein M405DRAFT_867573 [Rhizopogon salebrosus TDB-379]|nr:hypothetical protein M405DRAFT_867573 [Rhizopogon salebrosus TDB-379]